MIFLPDDITPACRLWQFREHLPEGKTIYWLYETSGPQVETDYNRGCFDVSKSRVHTIHQATLGYSIAVDPTTCPTPFLEKPERQCMHHLFAIHHKNIDPKPGFVYEKLLDNDKEIRYFYCGTGQDFMAFKRRTLNDFMGYKIEKVVPTDTFPVVYKFCRAFRIDFAELDILFDGTLPYVTDVNNIAGMGMTIDKFLNPADFELLNQLYINQIKTL